MSQKGDLSSKLRFSRRQVTHRSFVLPSVPSKEKSKETSTRTESRVIQKVSVPKAKVTPSPRRRGKDNTELIQSSPLAVLEEQDENFPPVSNEVRSVEKRTPRANVGEVSRDSRRQSINKKDVQKGSQVSEETPPPPSVEVSYLASTPKPGKQQLLRQRPFTAAREVEEKAASNQSSSSKQINFSTKNTQQNNISNNTNSVTQSQSRKRKLSENISSAGKKESQVKNKNKKSSGPKDKNSRLSVEKLSKALSDRRILKHRERHNVSVNSSEIDKNDSHLLSVRPRQQNSAAKVSNNSHQNSLRKRKSLKDTDLSDKIESFVKNRGNPGAFNNIKTTNSTFENLRNETRSNVKNSFKSSRVCVAADSDTVSDSLKLTSQTKSSSLQAKARNIRKKRRLSSSSEEESQERSSERGYTNISGRERELTISVNDTGAIPLKLSKKPAPSAANNKKKNTSSIVNGDISPDQTMMIWGTEDLKRQRADLVDIDVVLNSFSEILETQMDMCESVLEQRAVRMLEKYLTQDITAMIRNVQTVNKLQKQVRKSTQDLKQKKTQLLSLQKQRLELEEKGITNREQSERNSHIQQINTFIEDLQELIDMC